MPTSDDPCATAATVKHDRHSHSPLSSFTCPACVQRCIADGPEAVKRGRDYIHEHAEQWAQEDGYDT